MPRRIVIKHPGPRGWAKIVPAAFDPAKHEVYDGQEAVEEKGRAQEVTRTDVARMKRADVLDWLDAHGIAEAQVEGKPVTELRALLSAVMFVGA